MREFSRLTLTLAALILGLQAGSCVATAGSYELTAQLVLLVAFPVFVVLANRAWRRSETTLRHSLIGTALGLGGVMLSALVFLFGYQPHMPLTTASCESAILGDIRSLLSAQSAYQSANHGHYEGRLACLAAPWLCLPGYPEDGPAFIDEPFASLEPRGHYAREFLSGEPAEALLEGISPSSVKGFVYLALPEQRGFVEKLLRDHDHQYAFCGDHTGVICFTTDGERPLVEDGHCVVEGVHVPDQEFARCRQGAALVRP